MIQTADEISHKSIWLNDVRIFFGMIGDDL